MFDRFAAIAIECVQDLAVTVFYALFVGLIIVGILTSDGDSLSLLQAAFYASVLPVGALVLIACDAGLRVFAEWRTAHTKREIAGSTTL